MEVSFKFTNGENGQQMLSAIMGLFTVTGASATGVIAPADNPAIGGTHPGTAPTIDPDAPNPTAVRPGPTELDGEGLPWDERIHSASFAKTDKGIWRKRRGVQETQIATVNAENRARIAAASHVGAAIQPLTPQQPTMPALGGMPQQPMMPSLAPTALPPYESFVQFIGSNMFGPSNPTGKLSEDYVSKVLEAFGVKDAQGIGRIQLLQQLPGDKITAIRAAIVQALGLPAGS